MLKNNVLAKKFREHKRQLFCKNLTSLVSQIPLSYGSENFTQHGVSTKLLKIKKFGHVRFLQTTAELILLKILKAN